MRKLKRAKIEPKTAKLIREPKKAKIGLRSDYAMLEEHG